MAKLQLQNGLADCRGDKCGSNATFPQKFFDHLFTINSSTVTVVLQQQNLHQNLK